MATVGITTASNDSILGNFDNLLFELPKNVYPECGITDVKEGSTSVLLNTTRNINRKIFVHKGTMIGLVSSIVEIDDITNVGVNSVIVNVVHRLSEN